MTEDFDTFRKAVGHAIDLWHEVVETDRCPEDVAYTVKVVADPTDDEDGEGPADDDDTEDGWTWPPAPADA